MKSQTKKLLQELNKYEDTEKRIDVLKNKYEGDTVYIIAAGPSLNNYKMDYIKDKLKNELVMSIKQTYNDLKDITDFHLLNFCNFAPYDWSDNNSIVTWAVFEQFHPDMIFNNDLRADIFIPIFRNNSMTGGGVGPNKMIHSLSEKGDWNTMLLDDPSTGINQPWGPGIMYEMAIPLAIHLGCKKIVTVGWDIGDLKSFENGTDDDTQRVFQEHYYGDGHNKIVYAKTSMGPREIKSVANATKGIYEFLKDMGITWDIVSDTNPAFDGIQRIEL